MKISLIRTVKTICLLLCLVLVASYSFLNAEEKIDPVLWKKAIRIHKEAVVIDTHTDTPMAMLEDGVDIGKPETAGEVDLIRMKQGGLDAVFFAVFVSNNRDDKQPSKDALESIDEIYNQVEKYPGLCKLAYNTQDILRIQKEGKRAIIIGMENGGPLEGSLRFLRDYYRLGVRYITLTHNSNNNICDSATADKPLWNGLSPFGKEVVAEMNRLGMLIDISHVSDKAFFDVLELSKAPVFASHSCSRTICNVPRNMTDEMIVALAKKGGVIQVNFFSEFLDQEYSNKVKELQKSMEPVILKLREMYKNDRKTYWAEYMKLFRGKKPPSPPIESLMKHIDHIVKLVGIDHVGLGSDFDGAAGYPTGLENVSGYPLITYHLLKRGYKEPEIKKILGENFLRVMKAVEKR